MASKVIASSTLVLRIFALLAFLACVAVFVIDKATVQIVVSPLAFTDGTKITFKDFVPFRFVVSTAVIGAAYSLLQLPFAIFYVTTGKRLIRNGVLPELDFFGDQIMALLIAMGVGAGYSTSFELKLNYNDFFKAIADPTEPAIEESRLGYHKFFNRAIIATSLLCLGFLFMVALSLLSSITRRSNKKAFFG